MFQLLLFAFIGIALLVSVATFALRGRAEGAAEALVEAKQALDTLQAELLSVPLVTRIFAGDDLEFVRLQRSAQIESLFLKERKRVALIWVGRLRRQLSLLRRLHLGSARYYARLSVATEIALALDFATLLIACRLLQLAFLVAGPYAAPGVAGNVTAVATRVCNISRESLSFMGALELGGSPVNQPRI